MADVPKIESTDPHEMLGVGRRHLAVKDYTNAVTVLGEACELLSKKYGQQADECGEAYFWYGKSLLGLAREESGVLGDGLPGGEENQEDEEEENDESAEDGNNDEAEKNESESKTENVDKPTEEIEMKDDTNDEGKNGSATTDDKLENKMDVTEVAGSSSGAGTSSADGEAVENEEEDEVENLQIAWEVFELARDVFIKRGDRGKKELADVYVHLGEVSLESETYDKAVLDMGKGLELYRELYKPDDRRIAETHYQIGLSHSLCNGFDDAITHFKSAAEILETRIKNLQDPSVATEDVDLKKRIASDPFYSIEGEIKELTELLPEIKEKILDMIDYKNEALRSIKESLGFGTNGQSSSSSTNGTCSSKPTVEKKISDISHLVKRKRKPEDEPDSEAVPLKKQAN